MLPVFYSDFVRIPLPEGHRFPAEKYRMLRQRLEGQVPAQPIELLPAKAVTADQLRLVHCADYVARVFEGTLESKEVRAMGFPWSTLLRDRCLHSVGATLAAATEACRGQWAAHLAGGTHHAFSDRPGGYCVFNDVAVSVRVLQQRGALQRALVIDCDVHQGDGTAAIFHEDPSVFTVSLHGASNYPFHKMTSDIDVPLADGISDRAYLLQLESALQQAWSRFTPEVVFYVAGADPFETDRHGRLGLSKQGLLARDEVVFRDCLTRDVPVVTVMGGGYAPNLQDVVDIHSNTVVTMAQMNPGVL